jgi:histidinol-phosphate aminotransferase
LLGANASRVYIQCPTYIPYFDYSVLKEIETEQINFIGKTERDFVAEVSSRIKESTNAILVLTNPNNFTGTAIGEHGLKLLLDEAEKHKHIVVIDEAYAGFSDITHTHLAEHYDNLIVVKTLSKSYGMAGLRLANVFSKNKVIIDYLRKSGIEKSVSILSILFYLHLLENMMFLNEIRSEIISARESFSEKMKLIGEPINLRVIPSLTNFVTLQFSSSILAAQAQQHLLKSGLATKNLTWNNQVTPLLRITVSEKPVMEAVVNSLTSFLNSISEKPTQIEEESVYVK